MILTPFTHDIDLLEKLIDIIQTIDSRLQSKYEVIEESKEGEIVKIKKLQGS